MEKHVADIFPTYVVAYPNKKYLKHNSKVLKVFQSEVFLIPEAGTFHPKQTQDKHLENREDLKELYDWFRECLEDYRKSFQLDTEELEISLSWANLGDSNTQHQSHVHPNSWISGVYYVSDNSSPTYFEHPVFQKRTGIVVQSENLALADVWECPWTTGNLVLFPSWLEHFTFPREDQSKRLTISFNVMPKGKTSTEGLAENTY